MDPTARISDCQFYRVVFQNSGASTYSLQGTGSWKLGNANTSGTHSISFLRSRFHGNKVLEFVV
jgi:hypothetical protein